MKTNTSLAGVSTPICFLVAAVLMAFCPVEKALAVPVFTGEYFAGDQNAGLWKVDTTTGDATLVGTMGTVMTDIAFSPSGDLFGIDFNRLFSIDPTTAASTFIAGLGETFANALDFDAAGTLFSVSSDQLRTVNTSTGAPTLVGNIGFQSSGDLAFAPDGTLFMSAVENNSLVTVNPSSGAGTLVGSIGFPDVFGMDFVGSTLFGLTNGGQLISIDTGTGAGTLVANTIPNVPNFGSSTAPSTAAVPEPGSTLLLFGLGLAGVGIATRFGAFQSA